MQGDDDDESIHAAIPSFPELGSTSLASKGAVAEEEESGDSPRVLADAAEGAGAGSAQRDKVQSGLVDDADILVLAEALIGWGLLKVRLTDLRADLRGMEAGKKSSLADVLRRISDTCGA